MFHARRALALVLGSCALAIAPAVAAELPKPTGPVNDFAGRLFNAWGVDQAGKDNGALVVGDVGLVGIGIGIGIGSLARRVRRRQVGRRRRVRTVVTAGSIDW